MPPPLLDRIWYGNHPLQWALWPLSLLFGWLVSLRRWLYRLGWLSSTRMSVPVIVVGNISVGGTGKTPLTLWLVEHLAAQGRSAGIVSRGYGSAQGQYPRTITAISSAKEAGDEPLLLARRSGCPVVIDPDRVRAAKQLLANHDVDVIISDDGLQHYALQRDLELVVIDGQRRFGNGRLLPAGPLREPQRRLQQADLLLVNGATGNEAGFDLVIGELHSMGAARTCSLEDLAGQTVNAVAGIGNPERFFQVLEHAGLTIKRRVFPDHYSYTPENLAFNDGLPIVMTEKDAVKCQDFAGHDCWYLPVSASPNPRAMSELVPLLAKLQS